MRHRVGQRKLGKPTSHRLAMLRNMATSLFLHERIRTTDAKAKELRRLAEKMITLGKRGDLHARRLAAAVIREKKATRKVFTELADRYRNIAGGYTRIVKLGPRHGDGAMVSLVELVQPATKAEGRRKKSSRKPQARRASSRGSSKAQPKAEESKG
ncbi:MAG: 50S ribosomal protein L17 [bacterium]